MPKFTEGYVRGGPATLYMTRQDVIDTMVKIIEVCGLKELNDLKREAKQELREKIEATRGERYERKIVG